MMEAIRHRIRSFQPGDLPRLHEITAETFGPVSIDKNVERILGPIGADGWQGSKLAAISDDCRLQPDGVFVTVDEGDRVIGYVTTRVNGDTGIGWIPNLAVDLAHQGCGIGRALLKRAIEFLRESGMAVAKIETLEQNPIGQSLYPSLGFQEVARQIHFAMRLDNAQGDAADH